MELINLMFGLGRHRETLLKKTKRLKKKKIILPIFPNIINAVINIMQCARRLCLEYICRSQFGHMMSIYKMN